MYSGEFDKIDIRRLEMDNPYDFSDVIFAKKAKDYQNHIARLNKRLEAALVDNKEWADEAGALRKTIRSLRERYDIPKEEALELLQQFRMK